MRTEAGPASSAGSSSCSVASSFDSTVARESGAAGRWPRTRDDSAKRIGQAMYKLGARVNYLRINPNIHNYTLCASVPLISGVIPAEEATPSTPPRRGGAGETPTGTVSDLWTGQDMREWQSQETAQQRRIQRRIQRRKARTASHERKREKRERSMRNNQPAK